MSTVSIGLMDYSIKVDKNTFNILLVLFVVIIIIFFIFIISIGVFITHRNSKLQVSNSLILPELLLPIDMNTGEVNNPFASVKLPSEWKEDGFNINTKETCDSIITAEWKNNKCYCKPPFFGPSCEHEKHEKGYIALGYLPKENLTLVSPNVISTLVTKGKSFHNETLESKETCSYYCNSNPDCIGFFYNQGECTLLKNNILISRNTSIPYSVERDSNIYLKSLEHILLEDHVLLSGIKDRLPLRFWLIEESPNYKKVPINTITKINFVPVYYKSHQSLTGIYCTFEFNYDEIETILKRGENSECYIHRSNTNINISPDWKYRLPLFVIYLSGSLDKI